MDNCSIEDIEDLTIDEDLIKRRNFIVPKYSKKKLILIHNSFKGQSFIPGIQAIYLKTWGCSHNNSDSEYMAGQLASAGYYITDNKEEADLWILNSCTVKTPAEDHFRNEIIAAQKLDKFIIVAGCVPQANPRSKYIQGISSIGVHQIDRILEVVEETLQGHTVTFLGTKKENGKRLAGASLNLPKIRKNLLIEIIPINTGCLNQCTYCKTKHARGELASYYPEDIVYRAIQSFQEGVVELWITSEDLGAYGRDINASLPELIWRLIEVTPDYAMIRLGMTNPPYILEYLEKIADILSHPKVYSFLHIPVQSGSDSVLFNMKREYTQEDFRQIVDYLKQKVNNLTIATDIICGFPGETEMDLNETIELIHNYKFPSLFINQFFARPGTPAARMQKIPTDEVKRRTKLVSDLFASYTTYDNKVGLTQDVLITDVSKDNKYYVGHNKSYDQVLVPMAENLMGKKIRCYIKSAGKHFLMGEPRISSLTKFKLNSTVWIKYIAWTSGIYLLIKMLMKLYWNFRM